MPRLNALIADALIPTGAQASADSRSAPASVMDEVCAATGRTFVILIDDWDAPLLTRRFSADDQRAYLRDLGAWLGGRPSVELVFMTGAVPIGFFEDDALNGLFSEDSVFGAGDLSECFGFTEAETETLCRAEGMNFDEMRRWYGGYTFAARRPDHDARVSLIHPASAKNALLLGQWKVQRIPGGEYLELAAEIVPREDLRESGEALRLQSEIGRMLSGDDAPLRPSRLNRCPGNRYGADEWLALLTCRGYLTCGAEDGTVSVPNEECREMLRRLIGIYPEGESEEEPPEDEWPVGETDFLSEERYWLDGLKPGDPGFDE